MKERMIEFLQSQIDEFRSCREMGDTDTANWWMDRYNHMKSLYEYATGEKVTLKHWVVTAE